MIIFPFGFYILDGKLPVYVGNDLEAQNIVRAWQEANPEKLRLRFDVIGSMQVLTRFLGWNEHLRSDSMDQGALLFEATLDGGGGIPARRLYGEYDAAIAGHAELVEIAISRLY